MEWMYNVSGNNNTLVGIITPEHTTVGSEELGKTLQEVTDIILDMFQFLPVMVTLYS